MGTGNKGRHDLVITDFKLGGMDGLELAQAIRALCPAQPIVLVSAHLEELARDNATLSNVNNVLEKPFSVAQLRAAVAAFFPAPQMPEEPVKDNMGWSGAGKSPTPEPQ